MSAVGEGDALLTLTLALALALALAPTLALTLTLTLTHPLGENTEFLVRASYLEIYNEDVRD